MIADSRYLLRLQSETTTERQDPEPQPPLTYPLFPHNTNNVLDNLLPRGLLHAIIEHYFHYVYPLEPLVHRPTFMHDLHAHREERANQDEWVTLVLSIVGTTLCRLQALKDLMSRADAQILTQKCYHLIRGYLGRDHDYLTLERSGFLSDHADQASS
jgi:hypothetical protein